MTTLKDAVLAILHDWSQRTGHNATLFGSIKYQGCSMKDVDVKIVVSENSDTKLDVIRSQLIDLGVKIKKETRLPTDATLIIGNKLYKFLYESESSFSFYEIYSLTGRNWFFGKIRNFSQMLKRLLGV